MQVNLAEKSVALEISYISVINVASCELSYERKNTCEPRKQVSDIASDAALYFMVPYVSNGILSFSCARPRLLCVAY